MIRKHNNNSQSSRNTIFRVLRQIAYTKLFKKYTSGNFSFHKILANNLIFNDTCRIVARFKDYLIFDDNTEFLRRFYTGDESHPKLDRILTFYETYSKIFPNYMILKESKYLYRNIRKKQKMIDAVNEIKREEEENRKKMKQNNGKINKETNELFTKKVKEEIKTFQENTTFEQYNNHFDSDNDEENEDSISISVMNRKMFFENIDSKLNIAESNQSELGGEKSNSIYESFVANETNHSISGILNVLNDNKIYTNDLPQLLEINNYSKNSQKLRNHQKKRDNEKEIFKKASPEKQKIKNKNNQLVNSQNKLDKFQKNKKYEISSKQNHNKNISNNNKINGNYLSNKAFKKTPTPSISSTGTVFVTNTEKNFNDMNQYHNIIMPKVNTVININNNYYEQIDSGSLPLGYYTNKNFKMNSNNNINNHKTINNNSNLKKSNTNNYKNTKNNNLINDKKSPFQNNNKININEENLFKTLNDKKQHNKQISQDYIYSKSKKTEAKPIKNDKRNINTNLNNETEQAIKQKIMKFGSLSPQPTITNVETYQNELKKIREAQKILKKEKNTYNNYFTENNDPNLITGDIKGNKEDDDDNKERETLLFHIRDIIENNKKKENPNNIIKNDTIGNNNNLLLNKNNKAKRKINDIENKYNFTNFSKYRTISNFSQENGNLKNINNNNEKNLDEKNIINKELINSTNITNSTITNMTNENVISKKKFKGINKKNSNNENKKNKGGNKFGFKKLPVKEKKNKTKGILKNNNTTNSKLDKDKNNNFLNKINHSKNLFSVANLDKPSLKFTESNNKIKKNKLINERNNQTLKNVKEMKNNKSEYEINTDKGNSTLSHSILYRSPNSQLAKLLKSQKKEGWFISDNNTTSKIYYKGKIKNMKFKKDDLNFDKYNQNINNTNININSSYNSHINNYYTENFNNKIILTDNNNTNMNINSKTNKTLMRTHNINNSDLRNKYKSFLLKKNKQKSCELENQSAVQKKMNKELLQRMSLIKQNNKNNFYQKYRENKIKLGGIKSYISNNVGSFDNLSNSNIIMNSFGNGQNYARNSMRVENTLFQTPSMENKKLGLYKKVIKQKGGNMKSDKKLYHKIGKNFDTPSTIKVNRSKFLEKVKDRFFDYNKMFTMNNFNTSHKNF